MYIYVCMYVYVYIYIYIYIYKCIDIFSIYIYTSSTMVGTEEKGVIWHFGIKYDKYFIFLCKFFLFFPHSKKSIHDYSNPGLC